MASGEWTTGGRMATIAGQVRGAGEPVEVAEAEEHDAVGGHAEHDVLDGRLHLALLALALAAHGHEQVERERGQLEGDDERDDVDAAHEHDEPGDAQGQEEVVLGLDLAADVGELAAEQQDAGEAEGEDELEELGELVDAVGAAEEVGVLSQRQTRPRRWWRTRRAGRRSGRAFAATRRGRPRRGRARRRAAPAPGETGG